MEKKPNDLITQLINNQISRQELDILLNGMGERETLRVYGNYLENHFEKTMNFYHQKLQEENRKKIT